MKSKSLKRELNVIANPQYQNQQKKITPIQPIKQKIEDQNVQKQNMPSSPNKRDQIRSVKIQIETMKSKLHLLKQQLLKQQQSIRMNKVRTQDVIKKKINVNRIQKYRRKDHSFDIDRAEKLRIRNSSLRKSHQNQMQNILKAIYLVKLDDARQIKSLSKSYQKTIKQMNDSVWDQKMQKKKKIAQDTQKAKQKYEKYWRQKLALINDNKTKQQQKMANVKNDQLKQLREQQIKILQDMNRIKVEQIQTKKQYLAAVSLPVKEVAQALSRSARLIQSSNSNYLNLQNDHALSRLDSGMERPKKSEGFTLNSSRSIAFQYALSKDSQLSKNREFKVPNSTVNKSKLSIILKELKRLQKNQKQPRVQ